MKLLFVLNLLFAIEQVGAFAPRSATRSVVPTASNTALQMGFLNRFRRKKEILLDPIEIGTIIPETDVQILSDDGDIVPISIHEALGNGTSILVGMPGAFTTTCTQTHMPGYIEHSDKFRELGVNTIAVVTTNDKDVNGAWAKDVGLVPEDPEQEPPLTMVSDGDGALVRELGLVEDMGFGVGIRSKRFALVVEDGVATHLETDDGMEDCTNTSAENLVEILTPPPVEEVEEPEMEFDKNGGVVLIGVVLACLLAYASGGDAGNMAASTPDVATVTKAAAPAISKQAADATFSLLQTYR